MGSSLNSKRNKMAKGKGKKKAKNISNVYSCFEQSQIQEFKEAFEMIDANRDGFIDKDDLKSTYASLGCMTVENEKLTNMMSEASGAINFTDPRFSGTNWKLFTPCLQPVEEILNSTKSQ